MAYVPTLSITPYWALPPHALICRCPRLGALSCTRFSVDPSPHHVPRRMLIYSFNTCCGLHNDVSSMRMHLLPLLFQLSACLFVCHASSSGGDGWIRCMPCTAMGSAHQQNAHQQWYAASSACAVGCGRACMAESMRTCSACSPSCHKTGRYVWYPRIHTFGPDSCLQPSLLHSCAPCSEAACGPCQGTG